MSVRGTPRRRRARGAVCALGALALAACGSAPARPPPGDPLDLVTAEQLFQIGLQTEEIGDSIRAEQYFSAALERGYPESEVMPAILRVCVRASRFGDALDYAEPYLARNPEEWPLHLLVASIYIALEQPDEAARHLRLALELAPEEPSGHYLMAVLARDSLHDTALSREHFGRYLELAPEGEHASEARLELRLGEDPGPVPVRLPAHDEASEPEPAPEEAPTPVPTPT